MTGSMLPCERLAEAQLQIINHRQEPTLVEWLRVMVDNTSRRPHRQLLQQLLRAKICWDLLFVVLQDFLGSWNGRRGVASLPFKIVEGYLRTDILEAAIIPR